MSKLVGIIPARGGSKGLPRKNIIDFLGKPLIAHTIEAALNSSCFDLGVFVSSDDDEILHIASTFGAKTIKRPPHLALDNSSTLDVIDHSLEEFKALGIDAKSFGLLQPTSPLRDAETIIRSYQKFAKFSYNSLVTISELDHSVEKALRIDENGQLQPIFSWSDLTSPRQAFKKSFSINGALYFSKVESYASTRNLFSRPLGYVEMDRRLSVDIDSLFDLEVAEKCAFLKEGRLI